MRTLNAWIKAHPGVNVLAFERNSGKSFGFGEWEEVCGFCLASLYFDGVPPESCKFCRAPLRDAYVISDLPDIRSRVYESAWFSIPPKEKPRLFVVLKRGFGNDVTKTR
jgi:hypothetical protein